MPKLLHASTGLKIVQNDHNGFVVCTLHYSADPRKRTEQWKKEAHQGLTKAKFEQEYEISYDALLGEKIFPEIRSRRGEIVFNEGPFIDNNWPSNLPMWGGFDYGARNPSSFHVYTIYDGCIWVIWELYEPAKNIFEFTNKLKSCPYWNQIKYIASDPDLWNLKMRDMKSGFQVSVASQLQGLGVNKLIEGKNDESSWITSMQKHWQGTDVTFKILESNRYMIQEFELATYVSMTERQLETQNYREAMVDKHNHSLDDCKYFINSSPVLKTRKMSFPSLVGSYSPWGENKSSQSSNHRMRDLGL